MMRKVAPSLFLGLGLCLGCVRSTEERQLDEMREALTHVDDPSFGEKLTAHELGEIIKQQPPSRTGTGQSQRVFRVDGSEEEAAVSAEVAGFEAVDAPGPRPLLRVHGAPHTAEVVEQTMPDENVQAVQSAQTTQPSALDPEARKAYDAALALVNSKQYGPALDAFAGFLMRYPDHPYAANAMYWRGECYFAQGEYVRAVEQFEGVVARFPLGNKTPDALLKLGISQQKLQNPQKAQSYFDRLTHEWPRSDAARRIPTTQKDSP
jgi:tol-pal system protein YbgF